MSRPRKNIDVVEVLRLRLQGLSWREIAATTGLGLGTVFTAQKAALNSLAAFQNRKSRYPAKRPEHQSASGLFATDDQLLVLVTLTEWQKAGGGLLLPAETLEACSGTENHKLHTEQGLSQSPGSRR
jgi:hypothetical protein